MNFNSVYELAWIDAANKKMIEQAIDDGWEQITRAEAIQYCVRERERRTYNPAFAFFSDAFVYPYIYSDEEKRFVDTKRGCTNNMYIVEVQK